MTRPTIAALLALALLAAPLVPASAQAPQSDAAFLAEVAAHGRAEVALSQVAAQRASSESVRRFAQRMVADHTAVNQSLTALAQQRGHTVVVGIDAHHQALLTQLGALSGPTFDRAYMEHMLNDHRMDVAAFERAAATALDPAVRGWATAQLATLRDHLRVAQNLSSQLALAPAPVVIPPAPTVMALPAPSASPATAVVTPGPSGTTVVVPPGSTVTVRPPTTTVVPVTPWCGGAFSAAGTNFGSCPGIPGVR